jgi:hypothetical protein
LVNALSPLSVIARCSAVLFITFLTGCTQVQSDSVTLSKSAEPTQQMSEEDRWLELADRLPAELGVNAGIQLEFLPSEGPTNTGGGALVDFVISQEKYSQEALYLTVWEKIGTVVKLMNEYKLGTRLYITAEITTKFLAGGEVNIGGQPVLMVWMDENARESFPLEPCRENCELLVSDFDFNPIEDMTWLSDPKNGETLSPED